MQIWAIEQQEEDKGQFTLKVIYTGSDKEAWQQFYYLTAHSMSTSSKSELWLVEEDQDKVFKTKAKFKWEKH